MIALSKKEWLIPTSLIVLGLIPVLTGTARLFELIMSVEITSENARYFAAPLPGVLHIVTVSIYCILGAFQFAPGFRRRNPKWHRMSGRILVLCGLIAALSGLWLNQFYPPIKFDGPLIYVIRILVGTAWTVFICLGLLFILRRDFNQHRAWMIRGYALGLGGGTQVLIIIPFIFIPIDLGEYTKDVALGLGWIINLFVAEWIIQKEFRARKFPSKTFEVPAN